MTKPRIAIVGGGIAGLVAAYEIVKDGSAEAVLYEASRRVGGKLLTTPFAGRMVDEGADAFITRVPHAIELCEELGLRDELVAPSTSKAFIWNDGELKPLPKSQVLGVPLDIEELRKSGLVSEAGIAAAEADLNRAGQTASDLPSTVGALARQRLGDEIAEKLVLPLIGSINAGNCDLLDLQATAPLLAVAAASNASLIAGLRNLRQGSASAATAPVFLAPKSGMEEIARRLESQLREHIHFSRRVVRIRTSQFRLPNAKVGHRKLTSAFPRIFFSNQRAPENFDALVLAVHSKASPNLLGPGLQTESIQNAGALLRKINFSSVVLVRLAFEAKDLQVVEENNIGISPFEGSGFLVPARESLKITACSWTSSKWGHLRHQKSPFILRVSLGRYGDSAVVSFTNHHILEVVLADINRTMGITAPPIEARISRWYNSFPQYLPGHINRIAQAESSLSPAGIFLAGAGYHGIGVPACIASGRRAANAALRHVGV